MNPAIQHGGKVTIYVGSHKLVALEGSVENGDSLILRYASFKNPEGFSGGLVSNLEKAAESLENLMDQLDEAWRARDLQCFVVLGNRKLKTYEFSSSQYYQGLQRTLSPQEIRAVVNQTRSVATLPLSEFILQAIPESFLVNDTNNIRNPLGLEAYRLGVALKLFTMGFQDFKNLSRVFEAAELEVAGYFPKMLTVSESVLSEEEKEEGVLLIDVADDGVYLVLWRKGHLLNTRVLEMGGRFLSQQIAGQWGIELGDAQKVKERYGSLNSNQDFEEELIPLVERNGKGNCQVRRRDFHAKFLEQAGQWLTELLRQCDLFLAENRSAYPHYVFSGGGVALDGFLEFFQRHSNKEARIGLPRKIEAATELLVDPSMNGALGMYRWLSLHMPDQDKFFAPQGFFQKTLVSAREWFSAYF